MPYWVHQQPSHSLLPMGVLGFVLPNVTEHDVFVGLAALTMALLGFALSYRTREVRMLGAICAGGLLFAFGGFSVFHGVAYLLVPMVEKARTPAMAVVVVQFALAVLAAYGIDALSRRTFGRWWIPSLAIIGVLPWPVLAVLTTVRAEASREYEHLAVLGMVALALAAILYGLKAKTLSHRAVVGLVFVVALFEIGTVTGMNYRDRDHPGGYLAALDSNRDIVEFLRKQPDFVRLEVDTDAVPYNIGDWDGIDQFRAYLGGMTTNVAQFEVDRLHGGDLAPRLFALTHYAGRKPIRAGQELLFQGKSGVNIYRNPEALPHAWIVHAAETATGTGLLPRIRSVDVAHEVVLTHAAPQLETCGSLESARVVRRDDARVIVSANLGCKGMVILSETWYPGWNVTVDGAGTKVYEAYGALRGVVVDGGAHRIEFTYRPMSVYWGALLTAIGFLAALAMALVGLRDARKPHVSDAHVESEGHQREEADAPYVEAELHQERVGDGRVEDAKDVIEPRPGESGSKPSEQQKKKRAAEP